MGYLGRTATRPLGKQDHWLEYQLSKSVSGFGYPLRICEHSLDFKGSVYIPETAMSAEAYKAVRKLSDELWSQIEEARMAIPEKRRPSIGKIQLVLRELAWGFIDDRGYADPTLAQISSALRGCSVATVAACIKVVRKAGAVLVLRPATRGLNGEPGRAPRYGLSFYSPKRCGKTEVDVRPIEPSDSELVPIEQLRLEVARLDEEQRNGPTEHLRQQARLQWAVKHVELGRRENV